MTLPGEKSEGEAKLGFMYDLIGIPKESVKGCYSVAFDSSGCDY